MSVGDHHTPPTRHTLEAGEHLTEPADNGRRRTETEPSTPQDVVRPVFADLTGRRWRRLRRAGTALAVVLAVAVTFAWWQVGTLPRHVDAEPSLTADLDPARPTVVVGRGPLVRLLRLVSGSGRTFGFDAVTGAPVGQLPAADAAKAGNHTFVLQRYGYAPGVTRTISLTFDDGPSPVYTPALLDLLSRGHVPVTFFDMGKAMVTYPELTEREVREGHLVANHTMTHPNVSEVWTWRAKAELVSTDRTIRAITGTQTPLIRLPYESDDDTYTQESLQGILAAQRLGYVVASHDFDSLDWLHATDPRMGGTIPLPPLDGRNLTVLLHDGGDDRHLTVPYVERLITAAKAAGYTFTTMGTAQRGVIPESGPMTVSIVDTVARWSATLLYAWPVALMTLLFGLALLSCGQSLVFSVVAVARKRRRREYPPAENWNLTVSVVLAAYDEELVIGRTLRHILVSDLPLTDVVVVDDGSRDGTAAVVAEIAATDPRVRLITQENTGKAGALNHGLEAARGDIVVTLDADTLITASTVRNLVRHFAHDDLHRTEERPLGAVAGVVRAGNRTRNLLTRWQALEYLTQIGIERSAQDVLGAITIVPGACAAWRRQAILEAGGYTHRTLAEDCDLTLTLHHNGWRVTQDDEALAFTEVPEDVDGLLQQRVRWTYGTLQAVWQHRSMLLRPRYGWLGLWVLPNYALAVILPLIFLPLTTVIAYLMVQEQGWQLLALYATAFAVVHVVVAAVAVRVMGQAGGHLLMVPVYRLVFEPLRAYLIYTSALMALRGVGALWNKLPRSGSLDAELADRGARPPEPGGGDAVDGAPATPSGPAVIDLRDTAGSDPAPADDRNPGYGPGHGYESEPPLDLRDPALVSATAATPRPHCLPNDRTDDGPTS